MDKEQKKNFKKYKDEFNRIVDNKMIYPVFQPIVSLQYGTILGYEALSRIDGESCFSNIEQLFMMAIDEEHVWRLEQICRKKALQAIFKESKNTYNKKLFLNVSPHIINDKKFRDGFTKDYLERYHANPEQIIFEITEREAIVDIKSFQNVIEHYKGQEYQIAIDDAGSGYSGLNLICGIQPHYIKLDMELIRDIHKSKIQKSIVKGMIDICNISNIKLIAEGIENHDELQVLISLGVHYGQGYFLGKPLPKLETVHEEAQKAISACNTQKHATNNYGVDSYYIKNIAANCMATSSSVKVEEIMECFKNDRELQGVCVIENKKVVGIVTQEKLFHELSGRYGFALNQKKAISSIMDKRFVAVDVLTSVNIVSEIAMDRDNDSLYDFVVVTQNEEYYGIVTIKDLLQKATEININMAKLSNPLSGLPGNLMIDQEIKKCLEDGEVFTVLYLDLDNFKAFNDVYGFEKGDVVIKMLADILKLEVSDGFIGHIGGDDFVVILNRKVDDKFCKCIVKKFEEKAWTLYTQGDRERGYIISSDRHGRRDKYTLVSVTIVAAFSGEREYSSSHEMSEELAYRKKQAKKLKGTMSVAS